MIAVAAVALVATAGGAALMLGGGGSEPQAAASQAPAKTGAPATTFDAGEPAADANLVANEAQETEAAGETDAAPEPSDTAAEALRKEAARAAAAEARLAELKKAQAKAAQQAKKAAATTTAQKKPDRKTAGSAQTKAATPTGGDVSAAKVVQFYATVDDARSMARKVIRSGSRQNAQLARGYDQNLKLLRDSMRGIKSDKEADRLLKQATQTRAYVQFLYKQQQ